MRVAAGAVAKKVISHLIKPKIEIIGSVIQLGEHKINQSNWDKDNIEKNDFFCAQKLCIKMGKLFK